MPELPEVENVCRGLSELIQSGDSRCKKLHLHRKNLRFPFDKNFAKLWQLTPIEGIHRRAKYIIFDLGEYSVLNHLGMTGSWRQEDRAYVRKHDHVALEMMDGRYLVYNDPRRFGYFSAVKTRELESSPYLSHLGVEPLSKDFSGEFLFQLTRKKSAPIKSLLMDQKNVVGVGNIYASEALFASGVRPTRRSDKLTRAEAHILVRAIKRILKKSIGHGGTTLRDFRSVYGEAGQFVQMLKVYALQRGSTYQTYE